MNKRPITLNILSWFLMFIALSFPVQAAVIYGIGFQDWQGVFYKISALNWMVTLTCLASIPVIFSASRGMLIAVPLMILAVGWNNYVVGSYGEDFNLTQTTWATIMFALGQGVVLSKDVIYLLQNPSQRRWLHSPRRQVTLPITVQPVRDKPMELKSFDLSETGAFLTLSGQGKTEFETGEQFSMRFSLGTLRQVKCDARVVRHNMASGKYPGGVGIEFVDMTRSDRQALRTYLDEVGQRPDHLT